MLFSTKIKICGLTSERDVDLALELGADLFGFILYSKSPRGISLARAEALAARVPQARRVAVDVAPSVEAVKRYDAAGFNFFQIHTEPTPARGLLDGWSEVGGASRLWLAPRLKPEEAFPEHFLSYADSLLIDTYSSQQVGGTGAVGDWGRFSQWKQRYPERQWILAGGLNPENVVEAVASSGTDHIDVNSGVESAPGQKDPEKLKALFQVMRG